MTTVPDPNAVRRAAEFLRNMRQDPGSHVDVALSVIEAWLAGVPLPSEPKADKVEAILNEWTGTKTARYRYVSYLALNFPDVLRRLVAAMDERDAQAKAEAERPRIVRVAPSVRGAPEMWTRWSDGLENRYHRSVWPAVRDAFIAAGLLDPEIVPEELSGG